MNSNAALIEQDLVAQSPSEIALSVNDVSVCYRSYKERPSTLKETLIRFIRTGKIKHFDTFDALSHVTFEIPKGEVFGIIGSNGSGKSTMLKVLAGVLKPSKGVVRTVGTIASLIELGVGFDPELNAIENIFLNASLHKKTRGEIEKKVDHILDFAELREFSSTPIKYYSSGMAARLGFSVAIDIDPEILLVDEILAVGDERFQGKCNEVFKHFLAAGKTIVIVSHNMEMIGATASQIALMSKGRLAYLGSPAEAVRLYRDRSYELALE